MTTETRSNSTEKTIVNARRLTLGSTLVLFLLIAGSWVVDRATAPAEIPIFDGQTVVLDGGTSYTLRRDDVNVINFDGMPLIEVIDSAGNDRVQFVPDFFNEFNFTIVDLEDSPSEQGTYEVRASEPNLILSEGLPPTDFDFGGPLLWAVLALFLLTTLALFAGTLVWFGALIVDRLRQS